MRVHRGLVALVPCLVLMGSLRASADSITIDTLGAGIYNDLTMTFNKSTQGLYFAGVFNTNYTNSSNQTSPTFDTFCVDLYHELLPSNHDLER